MNAFRTTDVQQWQCTLARVVESLSDRIEWVIFQGYHDQAMAYATQVQCAWMTACSHGHLEIRESDLKSLTNDVERLMKYAAPAKSPRSMKAWKPNGKGGSSDIAESIGPLSALMSPHAVAADRFRNGKRERDNQAEKSKGGAGRADGKPGSKGGGGGGQQPPAKRAPITIA